MKAEDFLKQWEPSNEKKLDAESFLKQYDPEPVGTSIGDTLQTTAEELEAGIGRAGSAFAKSAVGSVRMITDLFGANNAVSKEIAGVEDYIDQFTTAQAKQDKEEISRLFQEAEGKGLGNKVMAGLKAVAVSPETLGPEIAGYMFPSLAAGLLTGGASIPVQIGAQATVGAAQAAGSIKGDIYQSVRDYSREQGLSEIEADRAATEAQSYGGKNLDLILTNAGIGALAASTGAERIATRILTGRGQAVTKKTLGEFLKQGVVAGGVEAGTEGIQGAAEQISKNIADQRQGKDVPTFQNVPQVATMGAVAGGIIGGGLKGVEFLSAEEKEERDINRSAEMESRSLSATDATTKKVINDLNQSENAINSLRDELDTLEPTDPRAQQLRMQISEEQKKATGLKQSIGEEFLSEPITEAERQQIELAKQIAAPPEEKPAAPVAAPATKAPTEPPVSMVGKEVIPGVTPVPVVAKAPTEPTVKESLTVAPEAPAITPAPVEEVAIPVSDKKEWVIKATEEGLVPDKITFQELRDEAFNYGAMSGDWLGGLEPQGNEGDLPARQDIEDVFGRKFTDEEFAIIQQEYVNGVNEMEEMPTPQPSAPVAETPAVAPAPEVAPAEEKLFQVDDELVMRSPYTGEDTVVSYRGKPSDGQAVVWTGKMQMQIPESWLREKGTEFTGKEPAGKVVPKIVEEEVVQEEVEKPFPKTKKGLIEELAGEEPKDFALAQDWKNLVAALNKQTKEELAFKVSNNREQDKKFKATQKITSELLPKIKEAVDAAGTKWVQALKNIASENGFEKWTTLEGNSKGEEIYRLANRIASSQINTPAVSETITPAEPEGKAEAIKFADEALRERDKEVGRYKKKADAERNAGREEMAQIYEGMINDLMSVPANEFKQDVIENPAYYIESNVDPFLRFKNKEVNRAVSTTEPEGISVGNRIKLGKSPQTYIVEEAIPQTEAEKANNEQFYSVKNERTGETQVVEQADMKKVGGKRVRKMAVEVIPKQESVTPIPEANRYTFEEAVKAVDAHFGKKGIPEGVVIVNNTTEPDLEMKAGYFVNRGQIVINLAYIAKGENLGDIIDHELGHYIFGDPKFQADFKKFWELMTPEEKAKADQIINQFYNKETGAVQMEEKQVRAFMQLIQGSKAMPKWKQLLDKIKRWINEKLGTNLQVTDRGALAVLAAAHKRFKSGEQIVREIDSGVLKMAAKRKSSMGEELGELKDTPKNIIAKTKKLLRERVLNPSEVTEKNTTEAFRALGKLLGNKQERRDFADELNNIATIVDDTGAAAEVSMGAALFVNDLFEYAVRLAAQGQKMMLGIMMTNINKLPTGTEGRSDAGRALRAAREMKDTFLTMAKAEQDAFINYAAEFVYGPNPTKQQVDSIKIGYDAVEKVQEPTAKEVEEEIAAVGEKTGTDLVGRINDEFTKATEKGQVKRKTEIEELDSEYKKIQEQADKEIEKLAKIQSDTPSFDPTAARQTANDVRAIVANDLKQRPDMGRKAPWKSMLVAKLQEAGVDVAAAETLADIVWRQHEINNLSRELSSINKAIEKGPISEIIKAIKETPLDQQQNPNWRYEVMRDYLRKAGLSMAQAERIAKLMDISLQKRFTQAKEQAFTDAISKTAPWKAGDVRSKRAFQQVLQAIRAGALDPSRNMASDIAAMNGWTGFTADQYKNLLKFDAILADEKTGELEKANAYKGVQDIISKSKLPIRARNVIAQYYDAQALSGIPTLSVNSFSPIAFAMRNAIVEAGSGTLKGDPKAVGRTATIFVDSIKSWANTTAFSFKNNVTVYSNVDYIVNDDNLLRLYRRGVDQFQKGNTPKERADGIKNIMIGMMDYVRRVLNALDYGAVAALQNQNVGKYAMEVMKRNNISEKRANEIFGVMMKEKNDFYLNQIAIGTDKNKARILADEFYISSWKKALEETGIGAEKIKSVMDSAINDAMSAVGRNRESLDAFREEATNTRDAGLASYPALWLLESIANSANQSKSQVKKLFARVLFGFAIVPARVIRETAWFSPYGLVRLAVDAGMRKMNIDSRYAQSLGTELQRQQRLNEAVAGTVALMALWALRSGSTDDPEDEDAIKIVFTGNGPQRKDDAQFYDSWYKAGNKPNSMILSFGKTKFTLNMMRGFEAFTWPAMMLGAVDDLEIRKKQKQQTKTPAQLEDAAIVAGFVFDAALRRGPYAFTTKSLFGTYGDIGVEGVAKGLTFPAKTLIPVLGTSLASNLSNFLNDPIDRRTLDGAVWSNIPFIGPAVAPKSLNAFGEPSLSTDLASKMFKLGVPIVYDIPTDRESIKLHELVLKQGGGPSIPTRNQLAQRLDRQPTNKEYEMFVKEYGALIKEDMKLNFEELSGATPELYSKYVERIGLVARDIAETRVREKFEKP